MSEQARGIKDFARSLDDTKEMVGNIAEATKSQAKTLRACQVDGEIP
jgi:hypothetical protein